ncbi:MAG: MerR family transcriptional regulator, partial [Spirochaetales bacterium]|nr:MerR family transcriptional regulator [Spirochaetales bacterium]
MEEYSTGQLAKMFGISVRTIQYYDKQGLLKADFGANGHRVYKKNDVLRLQQILFLKSFGFSLTEIRDRLLNIESPTNLKKLFEQQKLALHKKIEDLQDVISVMDKTIE